MPDGQAAIHKPLSLFLKDPGSISGHKDLDTFIQAPDIQAEQLVSAIRAAESDMKRKRGRFYASQSYGSGEGDPKGENPQEQGANPSESQEHPGPPSPNTAEGGQKTKQTSPSKSSSSSSENSGGPQPKIFNEKVPTEESEDVKKHNEDLSKRHDRPNAEVDVKGETVEKGFWKVNVA
ncbi:MAG: hypothetical protein LQ351_003120 [Letrouitia transgressa]|nr:MAG: hypothetical protein LQ351_003120 [Letrouitia transgressa]